MDIVQNPKNLIDGGNINQYFLLMCFNNYVDYGKAGNLLDEVSEIENLLKLKIVTAMFSETLKYISDLFVQ